MVGDAIATNLFLLGYAFQKGRLPVGQAALERAIELNGRAIEMNKRAFAWGRLAAHDPDVVERLARPLIRGDDAEADTLEQLVEHRAGFLSEYQDARYARRYRKLVDRAREAEAELADGRDDLASAVARYFFKLMAYKDEFEVARLYSDGSFAEQVRQQFEGDYKLKLHLSPQFLGPFAPRDPESGRVKKMQLGSWMLPVFRVLAAFRFLRRAPVLNPLGWTAHRRTERRLLKEYERTTLELLVKPCSASTSHAQRQEGRIDHSGARKVRGVFPQASRIATTDARRSSSNSFRLRSYTRRWANPWLPIS